MYIHLVKNRLRLLIVYLKSKRSQQIFDTRIDRNEEIPSYEYKDNDDDDEETVYSSSDICMYIYTLLPMTDSEDYHSCDDHWKSLGSVYFPSVHFCFSC